jgi:hypothetical protein
MERKFDVRFCRCGRIHLVDWCDINAAIDTEKEILLICGGCGAATRIGADDYDGGKAMYSIDLTHESKDHVVIDERNFADNTEPSEKYFPKFTKIIYSNGIRVPMKNGYYATSYFNGIWQDTRRDYINFNEARLLRKSVADVQKEYEEDLANSRIVDVDRLFDSLNDEKKRVLTPYKYMFEGSK